jgi:hypothetical protein
MTHNDFDEVEVPTGKIEQLGDIARQQLTSRRAFLGQTAAAGAGILALSGGARASEVANSAQAEMDTSEESKSPGPSTVDVLNYALTLEHLENTFYQQGRERFTDEELRQADILCGRCPELIHELPTRIKAIGKHEAAHVAALTAVVKGLGGKPVEAAEYDFGFETPSQFLHLAKAFENLGVSAYDGAIALVNIPLLQTAGATIATVEARHASYLNTITNNNPFPTAFDEPETMDSVVARASQFINGVNDDRQLFTVEVSAVSKPETYLGSVAVPLSPGAYAVHTNGNPIFTPGEPASKGVELIAEDGFPMMEALSLGGMEDILESGVFARFAQFPPALTPGETATFALTAAPGDRLSFATMFVTSNDLFFAPGEEGISLFKDGEPVDGNVTSQIELWDAGTEQNQKGVGPDAKPNQALVATDVGPKEDKPVRPISEVDGPNEYPAVADVIKVTVNPA